MNFVWKNICFFFCLLPLKQRKFVVVKFIHLKEQNRRFENINSLTFLQIKHKFKTVCCFKEPLVFFSIATRLPFEPEHCTNRFIIVVPIYFLCFHPAIGGWIDLTIRKTTSFIFSKTNHVLVSSHDFPSPTRVKKCATHDCINTIETFWRNSLQKLL